MAASANYDDAINEHGYSFLCRMVEFTALLPAKET
jgi:hypothetical protein